MEILNLQQGSPDWHQARATKFTASEAPVMMRASKYMSRDDLLYQKKTGCFPEVSPAKQRIFDRGHAAEEQARPVAEAIIGDELYPATGVDGDYLASFDGITMLHDVAFEHKLINNAFRALRPVDGPEFDPSDLDPHYYWQLEHQSLVSGCEKILFMASDGTSNDYVICWYKSIPERRDQLIAGWTQFAKDLEAYEPVAAKAKVEAAPIESLPSINYELNGLALTSNLDVYREAAEKLVEDSKKPLKTDQDFVDLDAVLKKFKEAEDKIKLVQEQVVGEIEDVDKFCKDIGYIGELIRQARINGEKAVKSRKDEIKRDIISKAQSDLHAVITELNESLAPHGVQMPLIPVDFQTATKNKRTLKSLQESANDELARAKIAATEECDQIKSNLAEFKMIAKDFEFLFADLQQLITSPKEALVAMIKSRIADHKEVEAKRLAEEEATQQQAKQEEAEQDQKPLDLDAEPITMIVIAKFLKACASNEDAINDFSCLLVPNDKRLNDEALFNLKNRLKDFCRN